MVEARQTPFDPTAEQVRAIADRAAGVGCDQLISIERSEGADARMRIWNADGGEAEACGNASRCVAWLMMEATGRDAVALDTAGGPLAAYRAGSQAVTVDLGPPRLDWRDIPLAEPMDTRAIDAGGPIDARCSHAGRVRWATRTVVPSSRRDGGAGGEFVR